MKLASCTSVLTVLFVSLTTGQGAPLEDPPCGSFVCATVIQPVCGSDGRTYQNECEMSWVCSNPSLTVLHKGECKSQETTTRKVACAECSVTREHKPVCGSNGKTYGNIGEFNCDKNCDKGLRLAHKGTCR